VPGFSFGDITCHRSVESGTQQSGTHRTGTHRSGTVRIAFNRPEVRNAFRPQLCD
jgi:naphthoate synthase